MSKKEERLRKTKVKKVKKVAKTASLFFVLFLGIFLLLNYSSESKDNGIETRDRGEITVFYSPDCTCCVEYIPYLKRNGFDVSEEQDYSKRIDILEENRIPNEMASCHTSIIEDYFAEGHLPVEVIDELLGERPEISGISLPGMPQGSPGMPGFKNKDWTIYSLEDDLFSEFMVH